MADACMPAVLCRVRRDELGGCTSWCSVLPHCLIYYLPSHHDVVASVHDVHIKVYMLSIVCAHDDGWQVDGCLTVWTQRPQLAAAVNT